jgi:hypothetical protein
LYDRRNPCSNPIIETGVLHKRGAESYRGDCRKDEAGVCREGKSEKGGQADAPMWGQESQSGVDYFGEPRGSPRYCRYRFRAGRQDDVPPSCTFPHDCLRRVAQESALFPLAFRFGISSRLLDTKLFLSPPIQKSHKNAADRGHYSEFPRQACERGRGFRKPVLREQLIKAAIVFTDNSDALDSLAS